MIFSRSNVSGSTTVSEQLRDRVPAEESKQPERKSTSFPAIMWTCILLACLGASWFSYNYYLIPQPQSFSPDWHGAQWIQAEDGDASVAYFRYAISLNAIPSTANVTIVANQVFHLYINGVLIATNGASFAAGDALRPYMYDISQLLIVGRNIIGIRAANMNQQKPSIRASINIVVRKQHIYEGTSTRWQATSQASTVFPATAALSDNGINAYFGTNTWERAQRVEHVPGSLPLLVSPLLYEQSLPSDWMSVGNSRQGYFVWQVKLPTALRSVWLRLTATDTASVSINGNLYFIWNGEPPMPAGQRVAYLTNPDNNIDGSIEPSSIQSHIYGYSVGVYAIAPYLHAGVNTIAIQMAVSGNTPLIENLAAQQAALAADLLTIDGQGRVRWYTGTPGWHASAYEVSGWEQRSSVWPSPALITISNIAHRFAIPDSDMMSQNSTNQNDPVLLSNQDPLKWCLLRGQPVPPQGLQGYCGPLDPRNFQSYSTGSSVIPISLICQILLGSITLVLAPWLLLSVVLGRLLFGSIRTALKQLCLAYLPALALGCVLLVLSLEPLIPQPFPYTQFWGEMLLLLVIVGYLLIIFNAVWSTKKDMLPVENVRAATSRQLACNRDLLDTQRAHRWLRLHWLLPLLVLIAIPLIFYDIHYEPYWQDELSSFYAAKGILMHGLPIWPSGFLYPKGELYSYILAIVMLIFGDKGDAPRMLSAVEFMISIPIFYFVGCYFFNRRVAALAVAMLVLSPYAFSWARQVRMYEQAQLMVLGVLYIFFKAVQEKQHVRYIYIAIGILVLTYLSHEEIFIILPGLLFCVLFISKDRKRILPSVIYQKHWWIASLIGASVIVTQLLIVYFSHPPVLGTDQSMRPPIQFTTDNIRFYINMLLLNTGKDAQLTLYTILAIIGCARALRTRNLRTRYCALLFIISLCTLIFLFTMQATRYFYPILTIYFLMAAYGLLSVFQVLWIYTCKALLWDSDEDSRRAPFGSRHVAWPIKLVARGIIVSLTITAVLLFPMLPISNYNLFVSRMLGITYHRHYVDYDTLDQYVRHNEKKGDIVISIAPDIIQYYYIGHSDYFTSVDRALFLFERNGHIVNTSTGAIALFNQTDLQSILSMHARIWLITDGSGPYQLQAWQRYARPDDFRLVYQGYQSAAYLRDAK